MCYNHFVHALFKVLYLYRCNVCVCVHVCVCARAHMSTSASVWVGGWFGCVCTLEREEGGSLRVSGVRYDSFRPFFLHVPLVL